MARENVTPRRILLVEDHGDTLSVFAAMLRRRGHAVITVSSSRAAMEAMKEDSAIDILICDIGLPDGDGWELMKALRSRWSIPGIAVTGFGMPSDHERSAEVGFAFHLVKPIDPQELDFAMEQVMKSQRS